MPSKEDPIANLFGKAVNKKPLDLESLARYTVENDRWDRRDFELTLKNQPEISKARKKLATNIAGELGFDEGADAYWLLRKVNPELVEDFDIRPSRLLNKRVNEQVVELPDFANVRRWTVGDPIASALAFEKMEPDIERLYDQMEEQMKKQEEYEKALAEALAAQQESLTAEEMLQQWMEQNEDNENADADEQQKLEQAAQAAQEKADDAQAQAGDALSELEASINGMSSQIQGAMGDALEKANEYMETINNMSQAWGSEPGELMRLPAQKRLELAKKLGTEKFRRMAQLIGPAIREAFAEQKRKVNYTPAEIVDLTLGDHIPRLIPSEFVKVGIPELEDLFIKDLLERRLVEYEMKDTEKIARGGIIYIHDGSGSMAGDREIWAKAIGLAFLHVARKQKRSFYGIQFGSRNQYRIDDFRDTKKLDPDKVIDFAEYFFNGGTDFETPLTHALEILKRENEEFGATQSDIVFVTDGCAQVSDSFMKQLKQIQEKLDVTIWGISIGIGGRDETRKEPLNTLCDGKVASLKTLLNATDIRDIFRAL
jgi:uncharacterized protein with von Willebrand factor type A (vWA) domain